MKEAEQDAQRYEGKVTNGMGNSMVKTQTKETGEFLSKVVTTVNNYLNQTTLSSMQADLPLEEEYCRDVLSTLRRMSVFCEGGAEACRLLVQHEPFQDKERKTRCTKCIISVLKNFYAEKDTWFENSRAAYTGNSAIQFYQAVPASLQELLTALSPDFLHMREELAHYEASGSNMAQIR